MRCGLIFARATCSRPSWIIRNATAATAPSIPSLSARRRTDGERVSITRVLSAIVLIVVFGGTVWFLPPVATVTLAAVAAAIGGIELARLARPMGVLVSDTFVAFSAAAFCILLSARFP